MAQYLTKICKWSYGKAYTKFSIPCLGLPGAIPFFSKHPVFIFLVGTHRVSTGHHRKKKKRERKSKQVFYAQ
jgi:hypothetical protein